ncbi:hypothetical protein F2M99_11105 [Escherichia coli]|nr:hypothetical protein [Escherichia coli]
MKTHEMAFGMGFFWFVLLPSPAPIYLHLINLPFLLYLIFYIILIQPLQAFRNRCNTSPFFCK